MEKYQKLVSAVADLEADAAKFYNKGNNAAGTRVRVGLQAVKKLAQEIRLEIQEKKNS